MKTWKTKHGQEKQTKKNHIMAVTFRQVMKGIRLQESEGVTDAGCVSIVRQQMAVPAL